MTAPAAPLLLFREERPLHRVVHVEIGFSGLLNGGGVELLVKFGCFPDACHVLTILLFVGDLTQQVSVLLAAGLEFALERFLFIVDLLFRRAARLELFDFFEDAFDERVRALRIRAKLDRNLIFRAFQFRRVTT